MIERDSSNWTFKEFVCAGCGEKFSRPAWRPAKYCSRACLYKHQWNDPEARKRNSEAHKGQKRPWVKGWPKGRARSEDTKKKLHDALVGRPAPHMQGPRNPGWRGGVPQENWRNTVEYRRWRAAVRRRDKICVLCGNSQGPFHADHIKAAERYPELRFNVSNGRLLCVPCHRATDNYGPKVWAKV